MNTPKIVCRTYGGFANRLRPLLSTIRLAKKYGRTPLVNWPVNNHCMLPFGKTLFTDSISPTSLQPGEIASQTVHSGKSFGLPTQGKVCCVENSDKELLYIDDCYKWVFDRNEMVRVQQHKSYLEEQTSIPTDIAQELRQIYEGFAWSQAVVERLKTLKDRCVWNPHIVGVHLRRTDRLAGDSREAADFDQKLFTQIETYLNDNRTRLFLATDCPATRQRFVARFNNRLLSSDPEHFDTLQDGEVHRSALAVEAGNVDFLLLMQCRLILGSKHSSYSSLAAFLGGVPLIAEL